MSVCVAVPWVYGPVVLFLIYLEFLHLLLSKCEIKATVFKNVVQESELSMKSDKKPEKSAKEQSVYFILLTCA